MTGTADLEVVEGAGGGCWLPGWRWPGWRGPVVRQLPTWEDTPHTRMEVQQWSTSLIVNIKWPNHHAADTQPHPHHPLPPPTRPHHRWRWRLRYTMLSLHYPRAVISSYLLRVDLIDWSSALHQQNNNHIGDWTSTRASVLTLQWEWNVWVVYSLYYTMCECSIEFYWNVLSRPADQMEINLEDLTCWGSRYLTWHVELRDAMWY